MALEDLFVPFLRAYLKAPQSIKSTVGRVYGRLPARIRLGAGYDDWCVLAALRSPSELSSDHSDRLRRTLEVALGTVPAYRAYQHLLKRLDDPQAVLRELPMTGKSEIKADLQAYLSRDAKAWQRLETFTGGSTAHPMRFYLQRHVSRVREYAFMADFHARLGMRDGDCVLSLRGRTVPSARDSGALWMHEPIKNQLILSSDHLRPEFMPQYIDALRRWRPQFVQAFPSALYPLTKWLALYPAPDVTSSIRGVMLYSETVYAHQLSLFRKVFDQAVVLTHYGHSERCVMAAGMPGDDRFFFWPQYGHLELVDERGCVVTEPGAAGEIVCTSFDNTVMPFVRYRTGDRGVLGSSAGTMLPGFPVLDRIEGRLQEMVQCSDGRLISITTLGAAHFNELSSVSAIQFEQRKRGELLLRVETVTPLESADLHSIARAVEEKTQGGCVVHVEIVPSIPRTPAGKQVMLLQRLKLDEDFAAAGLAAPPARTQP